MLVTQLCPTLWSHGQEHTRLPCPSPAPAVCSNSCSLSQWCHPTISSSVAPSPPSLNLLQHQCLFQWVGIRWAKYWSFSFSISSSNEYSGLISFRMDWFDLLAVQGTLKSLLQHHSSKASILQCSAFSMVQISYPCMTTGKTIALTRWAFVGKVMSLLFNRLSRLAIAFLPRSKHLLISWLKSPSTVILEPKKTNLSLFPFFLHFCAMKGWNKMPWSSFSECWVLSYQETCTSLLSSSIRGQTKWKPQAQKTNQNDHMDHSLV